MLCVFFYLLLTKLWKVWTYNICVFPYFCFIRNSKNSPNLLFFSEQPAQPTIPGENHGAFALPPSAKESRKLRTALWRHLDPDQVISKPPQMGVGKELGQLWFFGGWESFCLKWGKSFMYKLATVCSNQQIYMEGENAHAHTLNLQQLGGNSLGLGKHSSRLRFSWF